jgi:hypothetical protein
MCTSWQVAKTGRTASLRGATLQEMMYLANYSDLEEAFQTSSLDGTKRDPESLVQIVLELDHLVPFYEKDTTRNKFKFWEVQILRRLRRILSAQNC